MPYLQFSYLQCVRWMNPRSQSTLGGERMNTPTTQRIPAFSSEPQSLSHLFVTTHYAFFPQRYHPIFLFWNPIPRFADGLHFR